MKLSQGFAPVARTDARVLILGSMPGKASLHAQQYYAFPQNVFWKIMAVLFAIDPQLDYPARLEQLKDKRIALWDVVGTCYRPGSLDSAISNDGMITNDFKAFLQHHKQITHIYFNGQKAANLYIKKVAPDLNDTYIYCVLPSTSPAYAAKRFAEKLDDWSVLNVGAD